MNLGNPTGLISQLAGASPRNRGTWQALGLVDRSFLSGVVMHLAKAETKRATGFSVLFLFFWFFFFFFFFFLFFLPLDILPSHYMQL